LILTLACGLSPAENSKNAKAHTVCLSDFALKQFQALASVKQRETWIFINRDKTAHVCDKSISMQVDSRQIGKVQTHRTKANQSLSLSGGKWTQYDLRRTGATLMGNLGIAPDVVEKCLNHTEENKNKRIYQRQELKAEQAEAWRLLGDRLELLATGAGNVIPIGKRA
jgi:integrase